jgi:hypothetical protein
VFAESRAAIYQWNASLNTFEESPFESTDHAPSCVSHFTVTRANGELMHYIAVGNEMNLEKVHVGVNIYKWQPQLKRFAHHQSLEFAFNPSNAVISIVRLKEYFVDGVQYLSVAVRSDGTTDMVSAHVFRWDVVNGRDRSTDKFVKQQHAVLIPTTSVNDVEFGYFGSTPVLIFANSAPDLQEPGTLKGNVHFYNVSNGLFQRIQTIEATEPFDVEAFSIDNEGDFVAIANRQSQAPTSESDQSVYDQVSELYLWNQTRGQFMLYQQFDSSFFSVVEDTASAAGRQHFCHPNCNPSDDGVQFPVPGLRGVTDRKSVV